MRRVQNLKGVSGLFAAAALCAACGGEDSISNEDPASTSSNDAGAGGSVADGGAGPSTSGSPETSSSSASSNVSSSSGYGEGGAGQGGAGEGGAEQGGSGNEGGSGPVGECTPGETRPCYSGPAGTQGVGICAAGVQTCDATAYWGAACSGEIVPQVESCASPADEDCSGLACAQALWSKRAGDPSHQYVTGLGVDAAGNVYMAGTFAGSLDLGNGTVLIASGGNDAFLVKYDPSGAVVWGKRFGDGLDQTVTDLAVHPDGQVGIVGRYRGTMQFSSTLTNTGTETRGYVATFYNDGTPLASRSFGEAGSSANAIAFDANGDAVIGGSFTGCWSMGAVFGCTKTSAGGNDAFVAAIAKNGYMKWTKFFGDAAEQSVEKVAFDSAGNILMAANFQGSIVLDNVPAYPSKGSEDVLLAKLDATGKHAWSKQIGGQQSDLARGLAVDAAGNPVVLVQYQGSAVVENVQFGSQGSDDLLIAKFSSGGLKLWFETFGGSGEDNGGALALDAAGDVLVAASTKASLDFGGGALTSLGDYDAVVAKLDPTGAHLWSKRFGDAASQIGRRIAVTPANEILFGVNLAGTADFGGGALTSAGGYDVALAKFAP